jgi:hypothetical protein
MNEEVKDTNINEETENQTEETKADKGDAKVENPKAEKPKTEKSKAEPTVQELMNELAKLKRTQEKAASEAAEWKKKYRATLSEKEQYDAEKAEKEAEREEHYKAIERENQIYKIEAAYLGMGYTSDEAKRIAIAEADGDFEARTKIMAEVDARKKKEIEAEFYLNKPDVNAGVGCEVLTKEQFDKMSMAEKSKIFDTDRETYNRLMGIK